MYRAPIELVDGLVVDLWEAIDKWAVIPTTADTLEVRIAAAAEVEKVVSHALKLQDLIDARMALDMMVHRLRDGGPEMSRQDIRERATFAVEKINGIVPRSFLR